jgi:hypothetical protein
MWPSPDVAADVFVIQDSSGRRAPFIGEEPTIIGTSTKRVRARSAETVEVELAQAYDFSGLTPPMTIDYRARFWRC